MEIRNCHNKAVTDETSGKTTANGLVRANAGGIWNIHNLNVTDCSVPDGTWEVITNNNGCSLSGNNSFLLHPNSDVAVNAAGIDNSTPLPVHVGKSQNGNIIFTNCTDLTQFDLQNGGWTLVANTTGGISLTDQKPVELAVPEFTADGATKELPTLIKVPEGASATITFDVPEGIALTYRIVPFVFNSDAGEQPVALADEAGEWLDYTAPVEVSADNVLELRVHDTNIPFRAPAESLVQVLTGETILTGITDATDTLADTLPEYYTLQGVRVASESLAPGIYVRRQGSEVSKIMIR